MVRRFLLAASMIMLGSIPAWSRDDLVWQPWTADIFDKARQENRFVILDLEAVWCHWCHVMEETTYRDPKVVALLKSKYLTVRADQDAHPDLSSRYGDWGWPATIIFAPDGKEIVKRRGYIEPEGMASLLDAIIKDPSPGPSVTDEPDIKPSGSPLLTADYRAALIQRSVASYDETYGGWGDVHKFIDADSMDWELRLASRGDQAAGKRARSTLDAALNLIDREEGGIFQYSDQADWKSPHYEKIMWYQSNGLRQYSAAYALWKTPAYLEAARDIARYLTTVLKSADGAFYTSQDADVDATIPGKAYYALSAEKRSALGRRPRVDTKSYARENGWAISGLAAYSAATGDVAALDAATSAGRWVLANRSLDSGGFAHGDIDRGGPFLSDTVAMGHALIDLYAATGDRQWLVAAQRAGQSLAARFKDTAGGFLTTLTAEAGVGVFTNPAKPLEEQTQATRLANRLHRYLGDEMFKSMAEHGGKYIAAETHGDLPRALPGILLTDAEIGSEPAHITVVGEKSDSRAIALHAAGRSYPTLYKRVDWWDKREGAMLNPDVRYPDLGEPAAFACSDRVCSLPVFDPPQLAETVDRMQRPPSRSQ